MNRLVVISGFLMLLLAGLIYSAPAVGQDRFGKITISDGLSQSEIYSFLKSKTGHMWFGSLSGLNRYDGYTIRTYNTDMDDPYSLVANTVFALAEDEECRIWIGTNSGVCIYSNVEDRFYPVTLPDTTNLIVRSVIYREGKIFVGGYGRLYEIDARNYDLKSGPPLIRTIELPENAPGLTYINSIQSDLQGRIWFSCGRFLYVWDGDYVRSALEARNGESLANIAVAPNGCVWVCCAKNHGLLCYNPHTNGVRRFRSDPKDSGTLSSDNVSDIEFDSDGNMWVSTFDNGINFASGSDLDANDIRFSRITRNPNYTLGLGSNLIYTLYCRDDILWLGTIGGGVNFLDFTQKRFSYYEVDDNAFIRSVYDQGDKIYVGTHSNGLHVIDKISRQVRRIDRSNRSVFYMKHLADSDFWICSGHGLSLEQINGTIKSQRTIISGAFFYITESRDGIYWAAGFNGLYRVEYQNGMVGDIRRYTTSTTPSISKNNCRVVEYDPFHNELWIGTEGGGAVRLELDDRQFPTVSETFLATRTDSNAISNNFIRDIFIQNDRTVWIGTYEGINRVEVDPVHDTFTVSVFNMGNGLANNVIEGILGDDDGNIWISTNRGISKIDAQTQAISNYDISGGLQGLEFAEHSRHISSDGIFYFGGIHGITGFDPSHIAVDSKQYETIITDMYLLDKRVDVHTLMRGKPVLHKPIFMTDSVTLHYKDNNFRFNFSAMPFSLSNKNVRYSYRLLGYDPNWYSLDPQQRSVSYTNMRHGRYTLQVRAADESGDWGPIRMLSIKIRTPFYLAWYSIAFYLVAGVAIIILVVQMMTARRRRNLEKAHREKLYELEKSRMQFFINVSHDLQTPLTLILGPLKQILDDYSFEPPVRKSLNLIDRNARKLLKMVNQILDIRKAEIGSLQIRNSTVELCDFVREQTSNFEFAFREKNLRFGIKTMVDRIWTLTDRDILDKILFNILSNSLKYTESGGVEIVISESAGWARIDVSDTGRGIAPDQLDRIFDRFYNNSDCTVRGYGIGLSHCKEMITLLGGRIEVISEPGVGSTFSIVMPVIEIEPEIQVPEPEDDEQASSVSDPGAEVAAEESEDMSHPSSSSTILIVEDEQDMREFISSVFEGKYNVLQAVDGEEGIAMARKFDVDLIVSDVVMPKLNGVEMCKELKSNIETNHIPVILLTALHGEHIRYKGLETGADDYVNKPFDSKELLLRVRNMLASKANMIKRFEKQFMLQVSTPNVPSYDDKFLKQVMEYYEAHYTDPAFSIDALEREMALSHACFYRKIKSLTGMSAKELLISFRLRKAEQLVIGSNMRVTEIAEAVGFNNSSHFSSSFKEKFGDVPQNYRKNKRRNS